MIPGVDVSQGWVDVSCTDRKRWHSSPVKGFVALFIINWLLYNLFSVVFSFLFTHSWRMAPTLQSTSSSTSLPMEPTATTKVFSAAARV